MTTQSIDPRPGNGNENQSAASAKKRLHQPRITSMTICMLCRRIWCA